MVKHFIVSNGSTVSQHYNRPIQVRHVMLLIMAFCLLLSTAESGQSLKIKYGVGTYTEDRCNHVSESITSGSFYVNGDVEGNQLYIQMNTTQGIEFKASIGPGKKFKEMDMNITVEHRSIKFYMQENGWGCRNLVGGTVGAVCSWADHVQHFSSGPSVLACVTVLVKGKQLEFSAISLGCFTATNETIFITPRQEGETLANVFHQVVKPYHRKLCNAANMTGLSVLVLGLCSLVHLIKSKLN